MRSFFPVGFAMLAACTTPQVEHRSSVGDNESTLVEHAPIQNPMLYYVPETNRLVSLDAVLYGEPATITLDIKKPTQPVRGPGIESGSADARIAHENVNTTLLTLSGLGTLHPNWILESDPPGAYISGIDDLRPPQATARIVNLPEVKIAAAAAYKNGYGACRFNKVARVPVSDRGLKWQRLVCVLPRP